MTPQEMFNRAYIGVIQQGEAGTRDGNCAYYRLTENGPVMCGIGHVVGQDVARALAAEQHGAISDIWANLLIENGDDEDDAADKATDLLGPAIVTYWDFSDALQDAHDLAHMRERDTGRPYDRECFLETYKRNMEHIARNHGLTIPEVPDVA